VHVTLVGVAHVLDIEKKIGEILEGEAPEGVAIELDPSSFTPFSTLKRRERGMQ